MSEISADITPMMNQYLLLKREHPDAILFFRLGDFYEMFFDDARTAAGILGLTLTGRGADKANRVPMCGVPYHAAENYINRLLDQRLKVAICEQVEDPKAAKGLVRREIVRVVTPATMVGQSSLLEARNSFLAALCQQSRSLFGVARVDVSTGEFRVTELSSLNAMMSEVTRVRPREVLLCGQLRANKECRAQLQQLALTLSEPDTRTFEYTAAYETLTRHFRVKNLRGYGCEEMPAGVCAAGAALRYLRDTQKSDLAHIRGVSPYTMAQFMVLDSIAQRTLELTRTMRGEKKGSLLQVLDFTQTAMGSRLLVHWLQQPLIDISAIEARLDAVAELSAQQLLRRTISEQLRELVDIERLLGRLSLGVANARDLYSLNQSLKLIPGIKQAIAPCVCARLQEIVTGLDPLPALVEEIERAVRPDAPLSVREGRMIKPGYDPALDELLRITEGGKEWLAQLQEQEIKRTGITSLKIKYNKVFGYYIEITKANLTLVPEDYQRKQTLVNAERFITPQLKAEEDKILGAEERLAEVEFELFQKIRQTVLVALIDIQKNAALLAVLDVLCALAEAAARHGYTRPRLSADVALAISDGRHPVVEELLPAGTFIPNDTLLNDQESQLAIITGPNMAGKSTYIRQVALITLMAQMGSFVPAKNAVVGIVDRIFTRVGAADDITAGMSTFMMEMSETANILHNCTRRSLIILDEIGRGTSTFDGLSIAWAVAEYLQQPEGQRPRTLFATHYHELAELALSCPGVKNFSIVVREWQDEVLFLYKLTPGSADHSYGIHVARLAGLPRAVISRARELLSNLEINSISPEGIPSLVKRGGAAVGGSKAPREYQPDLFRAREQSLVAQVRSVDINTLTPLAALNLVQQWQAQLAPEPAVPAPVNPGGDAGV